MLGMPASHSLPFIERFAEQFEALGVVASVARELALRLTCLRLRVNLLWCMCTS